MIQWEESWFCPSQSLGLTTWPHELQPPHVNIVIMVTHAPQDSWEDQIHQFIPFILQLVLTKQLLYFRHCAKTWEYGSENNKDPSTQRTYIYSVKCIVRQMVRSAMEAREGAPSGVSTVILGLRPLERGHLNKGQRWRGSKSVRYLREEYSK